MTTTETIKALRDALSDHKIIELAIASGIPEKVLRQGMPYGYRDEVIAMVRALTADASEQAPLTHDLNVEQLKITMGYDVEDHRRMILEWHHANLRAAKLEWEAARPAPIGAVQAPEKCGGTGCLNLACLACGGSGDAAPAAPIAEVTGAVGKFSEFRDGKWHTRVVDMTEPAAEHAKPEPVEATTRNIGVVGEVGPLVGCGDGQTRIILEPPVIRKSRNTEPVAHAKLAEGASEQTLFENAMRREGMSEFDLRTDDDGSYRGFNAATLWKGWQAKGQQAGAVDGGDHADHPDA